MKNNQRLLFLLEQVKNGTATEAEFRELLQFINSDESGEITAQISNFHGNPTWQSENTEPYNYAYWQAMACKVLETDKVKEAETAVTKPVHRMRMRYRWTAAAAVLVLMMCAGAYLLFFSKGSQVSSPQSAIVMHDVKAPDASRAMITLSNGQKIFLDSAGNGTLATQNNISIIKTADGKLEYKVSPGSPPLEGLGEANTLTNPRGSKVISITLADGTKVWLNAESSLRFPASFTGTERKVVITGEAYFEVAHNAAMPFKVQKGNTEITVLGTHFNVNAYDDEESLKVTLFEGSVNVSVSSPSLSEKTGIKQLKPGQQAVVMNNGKMKVENEVNMEQVVAWKNGLFSFDNADLPALMRELSRWYGIEVVYAGKIPEGKFKGEIPRDLTLSQLLNGLNSTRIHFKIEGNKKVTILPE